MNFELSNKEYGAFDDEKRMSDYCLKHGDLIEITNDFHNESSMSIPLDQPLTLDEVRDTSIYPLSIHRLIDGSNPETDFDLIVIVLHALMLESGFQMVKDFSRKIHFVFMTLKNDDFF